MVEQDALVVLNRLRSALDTLLVPEVLEKLLELKEELGDENGMLNRYEYLSEHAEYKEDCKYTKMSKHFFLEEHGDNVILLIKWLHKNWAAHL